MGQALGLIETLGLTGAIEAADAAVKAANVKLLGYELTRGSGLVVVKILGDVGAVKAAVNAGKVAAGKVGKVWATHVIARPHKETESMVQQESINSSQAKEQPVECSMVAVEEQGGIDNIQEVTVTAVAAEIPQEEKETQVKPPEKWLREDTASSKNAEETCNLCGDPECSRKKGEPRTKCIHYEEKK